MSHTKCKYAYIYLVIWESGLPGKFLTTNLLYLVNLLLSMTQVWSVSDMVCSWQILFHGENRKTKIKSGLQLGNLPSEDQWLDLNWPLLALRQQLPATWRGPEWDGRSEGEGEGEEEIFPYCIWPERESSWTGGQLEAESYFQGWFQFSFPFCVFILWQQQVFGVFCGNSPSPGAGGGTSSATLAPYKRSAWAAEHPLQRTLRQHMHLPQPLPRVPWRSLQLPSPSSSLQPPSAPPHLPHHVSRGFWPSQPHSASMPTHLDTQTSPSFQSYCVCCCTFLRILDTATLSSLLDVLYTNGRTLWGTFLCLQRWYYEFCRHSLLWTGAGLTFEKWLAHICHQCGF